MKFKIVSKTPLQAHRCLQCHRSCHSGRIIYASQYSLFQEDSKEIALQITNNWRNNQKRKRKISFSYWSFVDGEKQVTRKLLTMQEQLTYPDLKIIQEKIAPMRILSIKFMKLNTLHFLTNSAVQNQTCHLVHKETELDIPKQLLCVTCFSGIDVVLCKMT